MAPKLPEHSQEPETESTAVKPKGQIAKARDDMSVRTPLLS